MSEINTDNQVVKDNFIKMFFEKIAKKHLFLSLNVTSVSQACHKLAEFSIDNQLVIEFYVTSVSQACHKLVKNFVFSKALIFILQKSIV